jgi:predicted enzyme related to lactoylglutathione lyase
MNRPALLVLAVLLAACATAPSYPPIVHPPTESWRPGTIVFHDLMTADPVAAKRFYGEVFGWTFTGGADYFLIHHDGRAIGGIARAPVSEKPSDAEWIPSLSHPDPFAAAEAIAASGGRIDAGPAVLRGRGAFAMVTDPQGAPLVLLRSAAGDPPRAAPTENGWLFTVLWTTKPFASLGFYESLAGWRRMPLPSPERIRYWILTKDEEWKAGVTGVAGDRRQAIWVPSVLVAEPADVCARAEAAGGRVLVAPGEAPSDGSSAMIADPGGAVIIVEKWTPGGEMKR